MNPSPQIMPTHILLKKHPKIEFHLLEHGFQVMDEQTEDHSGFYSYQEVQSVELNHLWFPRLARWLRVVTWIINLVPLFPDGESYKKASLKIRLPNRKLTLWLTDPYMAGKAREVKEALDRHAPQQQGQLEFEA